jgi:hypothetical protein
MDRLVQAGPRTGRWPTWSAVVLGIAIALMASDVHAGVPQGNSKWQGQYGYNDARTPVPFSWTLVISGSKLEGKSTEPATFGNGSASNLTANLVGTIVGKHVSLIKTYDGSSGVTHSVRYTGDFSANGKEIAGNWTIDNITGPFSADLVETAK